MHRRTISQTIYEKLCEVIPGGVNSPVRAFKGLDRTPVIAERGAGDLIYDADGNEYIDYCGSWGALILGHAHPAVQDAVLKRISLGTTFGMTTECEERLARKIAGHVPSVEKIRFVSSGTEATMSALRLARGYTNRDLIVKFAGNFHGHNDALLVQAGSGALGQTPTSSSKGIPEDIVRCTVCLPFNDVDACRAFFGSEKAKNAAAVIVEPVCGNLGVVPGTPEFLGILREESQRMGALLIFDEVINGFRLGLSGAQGLYGIQPDLTCFGKIIGGGFPAAAFGGKAEIMDFLAPWGPVYQSGTLSGNPVAMEAGYQTILQLEGPGVYEELERKARLLTDPVVELIQKKDLNAVLQRVGSMFTLFFGQKRVRNMQDALHLDGEDFKRFFGYMLDNGVYIPPAHQEAWFVSTVHSEEHLMQTRELILDYLNHL